MGELTIVAKAPDPHLRRQKLFLSVDVQLAGAETRVVFSLQEAALAPYRIDNHTAHPVLVSQTPVPGRKVFPLFADPQPPFSRSSAQE